MDSSGTRMLVVSDDAEVRERLVAALAPAVGCASVDAVPPSVAFDGVVARADDVGAAIRTLRAAPGLRDRPVIALVASHDVTAALDAGADDVVAPPWPTAEIVSRLERRRAQLDAFVKLEVDRARHAARAHGAGYLVALVDSSPDAIAGTDMQGTIVLFNRRAEEILGVSRDEVLGKRNAMSFLPTGLGRDVFERLRNDQGRVEGLRTAAIAASGDSVPILLSASLVSEDGAPVGVVGVFADLRERLRIEGRLNDAQQKIENSERNAVVAELAGTAAHELNQPLTSIMGYSEMLLRRLGRETPAGSLAETILHEVERMAEIVRKLGRITRYETKEYVGGAQILDLDRAARESTRPPPEDADDDPSKPGAS